MEQICARGNGRGASPSDVAGEMGVHRSTASRRLRGLRSKGFLRCPQGDEDGKRTTYWTDSPLPERRLLFPTWDELARAYPHLAHDWVHPVTGVFCVWNIPCNSVQQRNTLAGAKLGSCCSDMSVAVLRPDKEGNAHNIEAPAAGTMSADWEEEF